jgi:hypothetical protein
MAGPASAAVVVDAQVQLTWVTNCCMAWSSIVPGP